MGSERRVAVCDLGSGSFRLVVFASGEGWWKRTDEIYEPVRIGEGLAATGALGEEGIARGLATVEVFAAFCRATGVDAVEAVATSAIRDATNGAAFRERAALPVRVLPREEEARMGYLAAVNSTMLADGAVLDLGGGSLQVVRVVGRHATDLASWPLGAVRLTERFGLAGDGPAPRKRVKELRAHVARELDAAGWLGRCGPHLVGVGGTVRNLATAAERAAGLPDFGVQGFVLRRDVLADLADRLAGMAPAERGRVPGIKPARADIILAGAVTVLGVMDALGVDGLEATDAGLREGVFFDRHLEGDPPLFDDVRRASVRNLAMQYDADRAHTGHVAHLALGLFDELAAAGLHPGDPRERELLWAACELHDIGMAIDYDDHHKHSRYLVLNGGLPGFSPREVALVAQTVRFHRKGTPDLGSFAGLCEDGDEAVLARCATLLRLAEGFERPRDQAVRGAHVELRDDGCVELCLAAAGDTTVAEWAAGRERELFRRAFGHGLTLRA
jgi:exopolyphosphatase / guanosine-5'-triphosphate,3'-diphosphate pyrophosphatase